MKIKAVGNQFRKRQDKARLVVREKTIENSILSWLAVNNIYAFKVESQGTYDSKLGVYRRKNSIHRKVGVSDILGIYQGKPLAIEVKSAIGRLTDSQKKFLNEWAKEGGIAIVARSVEDVSQVLLGVAA